MKKTIVFFIAFLIFKLTGYGQPNTYFQNNETWSIETIDVDGYRGDYYMISGGDSIIGSDTLSKIMIFGGNYAPGNVYLGSFGSLIDPAYLVTDSAQILTVYKLSGSSIFDTVTIDFSRNDSITYYRTQTHYYESMPIQGLNSFQYNGIVRKIFNPLSIGIAYEGIFDSDGTPFIPYLAISGNSELLCFGAFDSTYFHAYNQAFGDPAIYGNCVIQNLELNEVETSRLHILPNPASDAVKVQFNENISVYKYSIIDMAGKRLKQGVISSQQDLIDIRDLSPGIYFIYFYVNNYSQSLRFVKQ